MRHDDMNEEDDDQEQQATPWDAFAFESYQALLKDRTILFNGEVEKSIIERVVLPLTTLSQKNSEPIKLLINSPGGSVEDGQIVVDAILSSRAPIVTVAMGQAMSAAFDIFLAGDKRVVYPNTVLMCHSGSTVMERQTLPQINAEAELHSKYFSRWAKWYASRTKVAEKEWLQILKSGLNKYYFPEEALELGITHEVIQPVQKNLKNLKKIKF